MNRNTAIVLGAVVVVLVAGAYFLWSTKTQAPVAQVPPSGNVQPASGAPAQVPVVTESNPDAAAALALQDGTSDAASPVDSDPALTQGDDMFVSSLDGSFDVTQF